jgi:hypothetical protein
MSTADERHFERMFGHNPAKQEQFVVELLSLRAWYRYGLGRHQVNSSDQVGAIEQTILAFLAAHREWFIPGSRAYGEVVDVVRKRQPELLTS